MENVMRQLARPFLALSLVYATAVTPLVPCYAANIAMISFWRACIQFEEPNASSFKYQVSLCLHGPLK